jgi:hypothetical protein
MIATCSNLEAASEKKDPIDIAVDEADGEESIHGGNDSGSRSDEK